jgi:uncharacterized protein (TIGR02466 family)
MSAGMGELDDGLNAMFASPIWCKHWADAPAVNAELATIIQAKMECAPGLNLSNIGGWHSDGDLLRWPGAAVETLADWVSQGCQQMIEQSRNPAFSISLKTSFSCWANVSGKGAYSSMHNHNPALFSGVYYVDPGEPAAPQSKSGLIEFMDPRVLAGPVPSQAFHPPVLLQPKAGMMLIFPGWLMHFVHPYQGSGQRISIAFNLRVKSYDLNDLGSTG